MPKYKLFETQRAKRRGRRYPTEVRAEHIEIHVPVCVICLLLSFVIWLYVVNFEGKPADPPLQETAPVTQTGAVPAADSALSNPSARA